MSYFVSMMFMLISSKGNFTSYYDAFFFICDAVLLYVGVVDRRLRQTDLSLLYKVTLAYFILITVRIFINGLGLKFYLSDVWFFMTRGLFAFLFCAVMREEAVYYIVKVTYHLAIMSIIFYVMQLVAPAAVDWVGRLIDLPPRVGNASYTNFIFFTYDGANHPTRNCGFSWEPGAYGVFLDLAVLLNFLINGFKIDRKTIVFLVAIVTTLSTTTYIGVLIIALLYMRIKGMKLSTLLLVLIPLFLLVATQVPLLADKIGTTYKNDEVEISKLDELSVWYEKNGGQVHLNRFGSAEYLWNTFGWKLFLGVSNGYQNATALADILNISNGDFDFMAKFGFVGLLYLLYGYVRYLKKFLYKNEYIFYCVVLILSLGFGEPMLMFVSTIAFIFLPQYTHPEAFFRARELEESEEEGEELEQHDEVYDQELSINKQKSAVSIK